MKALKYILPKYSPLLSIVQFFDNKSNVGHTSQIGFIQGTSLEEEKPL